MKAKIVVVTLGEPADRADALRRVLEQRGHRAVVTPVDRVDAELSAHVGPTMLVVDAQESLSSAQAHVVDVAGGRSGVTVITVHDAAVDAAQLWRTVAHGRVPWVPAKPGPLPIGDPIGADEATAAGVEALRLDLSDRTDVAYQLLARVKDAATIASACDALIDVGARALGRFRSRARYAVSMDVLTSHLFDRLGTMDEQHFRWWSGAMGQIAFHSAGVALVRSEPACSDELLGAFHAAGAVLRFTSRRQWRRADELFDELITTRSALR